MIYPETNSLLFSGGDYKITAEIITHEVFTEGYQSLVNIPLKLITQEFEPFS